MFLQKKIYSIAIEKSVEFYARYATIMTVTRYEIQTKNYFKAK